MKPRLALQALLLAILPITPLALWAQDKSSHTLPDDPTAAWAEVEKVHLALRPPDAWRLNKPNPEQVAEFQKDVGRTAVSFADKAREFIQRFPTNENVGDARITVVHALGHAVATGDADAEKQIAKFVSGVLADPAIPEDNRVAVLLYSGNAAFMKKVGMRLFTEGIGKMREEFETHSIEKMRAALKQFPTNSMIYTMFVAIAERSKPERKTMLAQEILDSPNAPPGARTLANHMLKGTKPYQVGQPIDLRFTAMDGRAIDLAKMKGKVVLVEFWSTTCGPCIAELPALKAAYEKFHDRGFEVVAISLDDKESALRRFIKEKDLPWPQHFDGKGWENEFAVRYGVFGIPTVWLVDKRGRLRDTNVRYEVENRVKALLEETTPQ
jgi:peroxiredoxin